VRLHLRLAKLATAGRICDETTHINTSVTVKQQDGKHMVQL